MPAYIPFVFSESAPKNRMVFCSNRFLYLIPPYVTSFSGSSAMNKRRVSLNIACILIVAAVFGFGPLSAQEPPLAGFDQYVLKSMRDWKVPGMAIAVVKNDRIVFARGYGVRELGRPAPVDEHSLFAIASNSKAFTAATAGVLVDEGKLKWDDKVTDHLRGFRLYDPYVTRELTVRDLLTHRSGLSRGDELWWRTDLTRDEVLYRVRFLKPSWSFRSAYGYQNIMFTAAGEVVASVAGMSWDNFVRDRIFRPLSMKRSNTSVNDLKYMDNIAMPHWEIECDVRPVPHYNVDNIGPAGSINSSAYEMAQWMRMHLNKGVYEGDTILSARVVREMQTPQMIIPFGEWTEEHFPSTHFMAYGLGFSLRDYLGRKIVRHGGAINGYRSELAMVPEENLGVIVLSNRSYNNLVNALCERIIDSFLGGPEKDWSAIYKADVDSSRARSERRKVEREAKRVKDSSPSLSLEKYAGTYTNEMFGEFTLTQEGNALVYRYRNQFVGDLEHWQYDAFKIVFRNKIMGSSFIVFHLNVDGGVASCEIEDWAPFTRVEGKE